jgi:hypothetical protein
MAPQTRRRKSDAKTAATTAIGEEVLEDHPAPPPPGAGTVETDPVRATVNAIFNTDAIISESVKENLKARTETADAIAERAKKAFAAFSPSSYLPEEREERTYLAPGDKLIDALEFVANKGAQNLRHGEPGRGIRLERTPELEKLIKNKKKPGSATIGSIDLDDLLDYVTTRLEAGITVPPSDPLVAACSADAEAERRLKEIEDGTTSSSHPAATDGAGNTNGGGPNGAGHTPTGEFVKTKARLLMDTVVSPEHHIRIDPPERVDEKDVAKSLDTFELRDGPSDVAAYHDFNTLQIAFRHVWTEVFDRELERMGRELFEEYVKLKDFAGLDDGKDDPISTVDDLSRLIGEIQDLSRITSGELPGGKTTGRGGTTSNGTDGAKDMRDNLIYDVLTGGFIEDDTLRWILNPAGAAADFLGDLFAGKQQVSWSSFGSDRLLPGGIDRINATFEENAVEAGTVEIVLTTSADAATWKGIDFTELDQTGRPVNIFKIANDPRDRGVWDPNNYNRLPLYTQQVRNGILEFGKEIMFGAHKAHYFLIGLDEKLKDRTRVTFNWEKDK